MENINIGLLDFGYRLEDTNSQEKLKDVIDYAICAENSGYDKFWIGEHHTPKKNLAWNNPVNLLPMLAMYTKSISIGTAGSLVCLHNPYHLASSFKFLSNFFTRRIDLGFANGVPYDGVSECIYSKKTFEILPYFDENVKKIVHFFREEDYLFDTHRVIIPPFKGSIPQLWTLGSSDNSFKRALDLETNICIWNISENNEIIREKIKLFRNSFLLKYSYFPQIRLVIMGICHSSSRQAERIKQEQGEPLIAGDHYKFHDLILSYKDFYGINDFMFFNSILSPKLRLNGIKKLGKLAFL